MALEIHWVGQGRGWPASGKLGCRRGQDDYLEVDPATWPLIHLAFQLRGEGWSYSRLQQLLGRAGVVTSTKRLAGALADPFYVTGEWSVQDGGRERACRPVQSPWFVPVDVFMCAQRERLRKLDASVSVRRQAALPRGVLPDGPYARLSRAAPIPLNGRRRAQAAIEQLAVQLGFPVRHLAGLVALDGS